MAGMARASAMAVTLLLSSAALGESTITREFEGVREVEVGTGSADVIIQPGRGSGVQVTIRHTYDEESYTPRLEQSGDRLVLREVFASRWGMRGHATWTVAIPDSLQVTAKLGSGDLEVADLKVELKAGLGSGDAEVRGIEGDLRIAAGSGNIDLRQVKGDVEFNEGSGDVEINGITGKLRGSTGSGDVTVEQYSGSLRLTGGSGDFELSDAKGDFSITNGSGDIKGREVQVLDDSRFRTGSGNVRLAGLRATGAADLATGSGDAVIELVAAPTGDLTVKSGSGDAIIDFDGVPISGTIVMKADKERGRIEAPFRFDREFEEGDGRHATMVKEAVIGNARPNLHLATGSGTAAIRP